MNTNLEEDKKEGYTYRLYPKQDFFLIEGMPVNKDMIFKDFISYSNYKLDDFAIDNRGYELKRDCKTHKKNQTFYFGLSGGWIYKGSGHLMTKSHTNKNNKNKIEYFNVE